MSERTRALELYEQYDRGELSVEAFLQQFGKEKLFYSTPYGDRKDGSHALFVLQAPENTGYLPVFTSEERSKEFFEKVNRSNYILMLSTFHDILTTTKKANEKAPVKLGVIVDPGHNGINVEVKNLDAVIAMTA
ncbi:MAG: SseB family protein [Clostridiales bacterium]|jgi:N-acetylmuramoyl-L-alanine amidase|nr:SseB family protein [Clostridiales bacterium]